MIRRGFKYRIYPNTKQKEFFAKCFGCVRFFYNKSLTDMINFYLETGKSKNITPASYKKDYSFLKDVDAQALCNAQLIRNTAFKNFFLHNKGFPKYKSKRYEQSYTTSMVNENIKIFDDCRHFQVPKCRRIRIKMHRRFNGVIKSATISKTSDEKYYVSFLVETEVVPVKESNKTIGLDLGIKHLVVDSEGKKYTNRKYLTKSQLKLAREQRKLAKTEIGSNNHSKQRIKVARVFRHIKNQRNDYLHKLSKKIIDENQIICLEDLKIQNLAKNRKLTRNIMDASWYKFVSYLVYKADWYGRTIVKIPSKYPSSQLCSACGEKISIIKDLGVRKWTCCKCGAVHDRDINAAKNILSKGIEMLTKDGTHPDSLFMLDSLEPSSKKPSLS